MELPAVLHLVDDSADPAQPRNPGKRAEVVKKDDVGRRNGKRLHELPELAIVVDDPPSVVDHPDDSATGLKSRVNVRPQRLREDEHRRHSLPGQRLTEAKVPILLARPRQRRRIEQQNDTAGLHSEFSWGHLEGRHGRKAGKAHARRAGRTLSAI